MMPGHAAPAPGLRFGNAELRPDQRVLLVGGAESHIGARAFDLLLALVERRDRVVGKNELLDRVWPGVVVEENNLQVHISTLRKVLGPRAIATIPGRGYRFTGELADAADAGPAAAPVATPAGNDAHGPSSNLAPDNPPLYGRGTELQALRSLLASHRLVTITGGGGIGKTALAQALAHELRESFPDGVWRVELAPLASPSLVAGAVAGVLQVSLNAATQVESLARALGARRMLVVLDNCEHVIDAVAELARALQAGAPGVKLLATSQEPLKLTHERVYRLGPLELPADAAAEDARQAGAVALFEARALAADPRFTLGPHNIHAVADICARLDGIPLAIELAAARLPLLGLEGLRARLVERFRVLKGGARDASSRHQTLRAAMEWSHGLLTRDEQVVLRRLAVFAGGFRLESAQHVAHDAELDEWMVLDQLAALVDKSLVVVVAQDGPQPRYKLLETTRAFAREMLHGSNEAAAVRHRHCEAVLAIYEASLDEETREPPYKLLPRYIPDLDNARAALDWAGGPEGDAVLHVALAGAMPWIWEPAGLRPEGMRRMRDAMAQIDGATPPHLQARLLAAWPWVAWPQIGSQELDSAERAIELLRRLGDRIGLFRVLTQQAKLLATIGRHEEAGAALDEAQALYEPAWPRRLYARLLVARGYTLLERGEIEASIAACTELCAVAREIGDRAMELSAMVNMEQDCATLGRWDEAAARGYQMVELLGDNRVLRQQIEIYAVGNLCLALTELGRLPEAMEMARRSLALQRQFGHMECGIDHFTCLAFKRGHVRDAARLLGYADAAYARTGSSRQCVEAKLHDAVAAGLQQALPSGELARLMQEGVLLGEEAAVSLALHDSDG